MAGAKQDDFYHLLGVAPDASEDEIKKAYRRKAREMHPDLDPDNPWAEDDFKKLSAAYQILSDPTSRKRYDRGEISGDGTRKDKKRPSGRPKKPTKGFENPFTGSGAPNIDGIDVSYVLKIDFLEAARGVTREMKTTHGATLKVVVPPGTLNAQVLRLRGQGMRGFGRGKDGDALIEVEVSEHPVYKNHGRDIFTEIPVDLETAVLGGKVQVETIDGIVNVKVPPNSNTGTKLRLRERGLANGGRKSEKRGDHFVSLIVNLPEDPDPELAEFIRARAERSET